MAEKLRALNPLTALSSFFFASVILLTVLVPMFAELKAYMDIAGDDKWATSEPVKLRLLATDGKRDLSLIREGAECRIEVSNGGSKVLRSPCPPRVLNYLDLTAKDDEKVNVKQKEKADRPPGKEPDQAKTDAAAEARKPPANAVEPIPERQL